MGDEASFSFDWNEYLHLKRDWRNDIINTSLREHPEYLEMEGGSCACVMFIRKYPNGLTDQFLNELTNMDFPIIYSMDVEPLDNDVAYQMVMNKYMSNARSINREQELKNENGDYSTNINYDRRNHQRDTEEMLDRISSFDERLLYVGITIVVKAASCLLYTSAYLPFTFTRTNRNKNITLGTGTLKQRLDIMSRQKEKR